MGFANRLKEARMSRGMSQKQLAILVGVSSGAISNYENGVSSPNEKIMYALFDALGVTPNFLFQDEYSVAKNGPDILALPGILPIPKTKKVPRLGTIACGEPALAIEEANEFDEAPIDIDCDFTLICKGDSMINARIYDGDVVYVRSQPDVENGQIAAVIIDDEALLKRVYKHPGQIVLAPENPAFRSIIVTGPQLNDVRILGLAVWFRSRVR